MKTSFTVDESRQLDALRGLAALSVVAVHFGQIMWRVPHVKSLNFVLDHGKHGVALFFVLSGYLLTVGLNRAAISKGLYRNFMARRFFRIYPAYIVCLFIVWGCSSEDAPQLLSHIFLLHFLNYRFFGGVNYPFWSLSVEFWFYALLPWILMLLNKKKLSAELFLYISIASGLWWELIPGICRARYHFDANFNWSARLFILTSLPALAIGVYKARRESGTRLANLVLSSGALIASLDLIIGFLPNTGFIFKKSHTITDFAFKGSFGFFAYACLSYYLIDLIKKGRFNFTRNAFARVGVISYSLYLWHVPILNYCANHFAGSYVSAASSFFLILVIANVSYFLIEKPLIAFARKRFSMN